jgi:hypothetical protein
MKRARQQKLDSYEKMINLSVSYRHLNTSKGPTGRRTLKNFKDYRQKSYLLKAKALLELLQQERQAHFLKRRQRTPVIFVIGITF